MRLNRLDLNQLHTLELLLQQRSPSTVAARLHVTQPAISAALRRLRAYFNDPLLVQSGKQMVPTAFALSLAAPLREMLMRAEALRRLRPHNVLATYDRTVRIAVSDFIATVLLTPILRKAPSVAPRLRFELVSVFDSRHHYHEDLDRGEVDPLILPQAYASGSHRQQTLLDEIYVCIACRRRPALRRGLSLQQFQTSPHGSGVGPFESSAALPRSPRFAKSCSGIHIRTMTRPLSGCAPNCSPRVRL